METELKLLLAPNDVAAFRRLPLLDRLAAGPPVSRRQVDSYFDTADRRLHAQGLLLRVRRQGRTTLQTLKIDAPAQAGLHRRHEWEGRIVGPRPDLDRLLPLLAGAGASAARLLGAPGLAQALVPIFESRVRRTVWRLKLGQAEIELALDHGELRADAQRSQPICEVELELKAGEPAALFDLALQLQALLPLRLGGSSKAARGHALGAAPSPPAAVKAAAVVLDANATIEQGFRTIVVHYLTQLRDNEAGVLRGADDPECVHQMRVALRRLRSALRWFARWVPFPPVLRDELRWLDAELAAARDADVFAADTLAPVLRACPADPDGIPLQALQRVAVLAAREAHQRAALAVGSQRQARLMLQLAGWLQASAWRVELDDAGREALDEPLAPQAHALLGLRLRKVLRRGRRLAQADAQERHDLRIAAKKARYALEFFRSLDVVSHAARRSRRLAAVLDSLGALNDAQVAERRLVELAQRHAELAAGAAFVRGWLRAEEAAALEVLHERWKAFVRGRRRRRGSG